MTRIAFVGLGNMGGRMVGHLVRAGHEVSAFDVSPEALAAAAADGCRPAASAADAARGAEAVITMLPTGEHVEAVWRDGVLSALQSSALLIDCSTIAVDAATRLSGLAQDAGLRFADAPVSGGIMAAAAGTLTFMVGCPEDQFAGVEALLAPMAKAVFHAGDWGAGQAAKICNNMLLGISMIGSCEAFALAEQLGLDAGRFFEIANRASGQCWSLSTYCPVPGVGPETPADHDYEGGFAVAMMLKDLKLAQDAAARSGAATPLGAQAEALYALLDRQGAGRKDFSVMFDMIRGRTVTTKEPAR